jgi:branched-chain amino acid transport system ATP-binding protein
MTEITAAPPLIEARKLTMRFGGVTAIADVDLTVAEGELRCLIGPNGAGKSTFFKMLTGQLMPSEGEILFRGTRINGFEPHDIARLGIGIKTQVPNVFDGLTVRENLWIAASRHKRGKAIDRAVAQELDRLELGPIADRLVGQLAHGQRQWIELGLVLLTEPVLILLDEPAAGMTEDETVRTAQLIGVIKQTCSLIVVEHDMAFIRMIASRITVFDRGRILVEGEADAVLADQRVRDVYLGRRAA